MLKLPGVSGGIVHQVSNPVFRLGTMSSDNPSGAGNQQERLSLTIVGGFRGRGRRLFQPPHLSETLDDLGWQVQPAFAVVQGASSRDVLDEMVPFFGCGKVYVNRRHDNHGGSVPLLRSRRVICGRDRPVLPRTNRELRSERISRQVRRSHRTDRARRHLTVSGLIEIAEIAQTMNFRKPSEVLRILRDHTPTLFPSRGKKMRWSVPYGDVGRLTETSARHSGSNAT